MLAGKSYYHVPQPIGRSFHPGKLNGYFNDMTGKTGWKGLLDGGGIPVNQLIDGSTCYFATTIIQKALGHHDQYLITGEKRELREFINICDWLMKMQDEKGGWDVKKVMDLTGDLRYSAMPQGEAVSALVRAWKKTDSKRCLDAAIKAYDLLITPISKGGTAHYDNDRVYLEEYPAKGKNTVLNGWIFALFGVYDLFLATGNEEYRKLFDQSLFTLIATLHVYDAGFWSYYDEKKALASLFYHDLHISQLEALSLVAGTDRIADYIEKWKGYRRKGINRWSALFFKAYQKIKSPAPVVIIE